MLFWKSKKKDKEVEPEPGKKVGPEPKKERVRFPGRGVPLEVKVLARFSMNHSATPGLFSCERRYASRSSRRRSGSWSSASVGNGSVRTFHIVIPPVPHRAMA